MHCTRRLPSEGPRAPVSCGRASFLPSKSAIKKAQRGPSLHLGAPRSVSDQPPVPSGVYKVSATSVRAPSCPGTAAETPQPRRAALGPGRGPEATPRLASPSRSVFFGCQLGLLAACSVTKAWRSTHARALTCTGNPEFHPLGPPDPTRTSGRPAGTEEDPALLLPASRFVAATSRWHTRVGLCSPPCSPRVPLSR